MVDEIGGRVAYARMGRKPGDQLMELLDGQMETISGDFKSQHVSDTLWAYARMRRKPGERLMGLLEGRMETISGEFSSQNVSDTLWAYATIGRKPGERLMGLYDTLVATCPKTCSLAGIVLYTKT